MSYFVIQVGRCGNKLGHTFFTTLDEITSKKRNNKNYDFLDESNSRFFSYNEKEDKKIAHAILLDNKNSQAIFDITKPNRGSWGYRRDCYRQYKSEILSCWAEGYKVLGPSCREFILDAVRKEVECYDQFYGFLMFGSISGHSSSGVTSYATELLRDEFPSVSMANICFSLFEKGIGGLEVYNAVQNLSTLQNFSDAIFMIEFSYLTKLCVEKMGMEDAIDKDVFLVASYQLANLLLPVDSYHSTYPALNDLLSLLVPHPQFKLIKLRSVPQQSFSSLPYCSHDWPTLFRNLHRMLLYSTDTNEVCRKKNIPPPITSLPVTLTNLLILRGKDCELADINYLHKPRFPYASWVPKSSRMSIWTHSNPFLSCDRTALIANNGQFSAKYLDKTAACGWRYLKHKSFFHHFDWQGLTEEDVHSSLLDVQQIVSSYQSLKA